jgi:hypothetical protein
MPVQPEHQLRVVPSDPADLELVTPAEFHGGRDPHTATPSRSVVVRPVQCSFSAYWRTIRSIVPVSSVRSSATTSTGMPRVGGELGRVHGMRARGLLHGGGVRFADDVMPPRPSIRQ